MSYFFVPGFTPQGSSIMPSRSYTGIQTSAFLSSSRSSQRQTFSNHAFTSQEDADVAIPKLRRCGNIQMNIDPYSYRVQKDMKTHSLDDLKYEMTYGENSDKVLALIRLGNQNFDRRDVLDVIKQSMVLYDTDFRLRSNAFFQLAKLADKEHLELVLESGLKDQDHSVRAGAANGLGYLPDNEDDTASHHRVVDALMDLYKNDSHFVVRHSCLCSLGSFEHQDLPEFFKAVLKNRESSELEIHAAIQCFLDLKSRGRSPVGDNVFQHVALHSAHDNTLVRNQVAFSAPLFGNKDEALALLKRMKLEETVDFVVKQIDISIDMLNKN